MCHGYFKQVLTTSPFGGEVPQMFLSLTATRFFGSHDSCHDFLDYANYAHFAMNSYNNDVKTITLDLFIVKAFTFQILERPHYSERLQSGSVERRHRSSREAKI